MSPPEPLHYRSIRELAPLLRSRQLSPVELTRAFLDRIQALDGRVHAYITVTAERALADAQAAEAAIGRGTYGGPLHGIPLALKDLFVTGGIRTTAHSQLLANWVPAADGAIAARLREAGSVLLGKLALSEFAYGDSNPAVSPPARNPWDLGRAPGFSSSGSGAAVAAGLCAASVGSDTGGSIRQPASLCGIVGLKPTYGRVTRRGGLPLSWSLDHFGPMTRRVEDAAILLQAMAGHDPEDPVSSRTTVPDYRAALGQGVRGLRVGVPRAFFFARDGEADPEVMDAAEAALELLGRLGAHLEEVDIPSIRCSRPAQSLILTAEALAYHQRSLLERARDLSPRLRLRLRLAMLFRGADYLRALRIRGVLLRETTTALAGADVLVTPATPQAAWRLDADPHGLSRNHNYRFVNLFNLTGLPAISIPCGFTRSGLPIGLQIAARPFAEPTILRVAHAYEQEAGWFQRHPPL